MKHYVLKVCVPLKTQVGEFDDEINNNNGHFIKKLIIVGWNCCFQISKIFDRFFFQFTVYITCPYISCLRL